MRAARRPGAHAQGQQIGMKTNRFSGVNPQTGSQYSSLHMSKLLLKVACKAEVDEINGRQVEEPKKPPKRPHSGLTDAQILEARALYEFAGWSNKRVAEHTGLDLATVKRITSGATGAKLFATIKHLPDGVEPLVGFRK
jgi:hypothetical protein